MQCFLPCGWLNSRSALLDLMRRICVCRRQIVFMDVHAGSVDGPTVARTIRSRLPASKMPYVVLISSDPLYTQVCPAPCPESVSSTLFNGKVPCGQALAHRR